MALKFHRNIPDEADLDVTAFLNLMIVLVPVLLLTMTFTQTAVLEIKLPELTGGFGTNSEPQSKLEVKITDSGIKVYYPENVMVKNIAATKVGSEKIQYDFEQLSLVMRAIKKERPEKRDVVVLAAPEVGYQDLVFTMDAVKSYKTVVVTSLEEVELFPEISLGDAG